MIRRLLFALIPCAFVAFALLVWRLAQGPLSLEFVTPYLEDALRDEQDDWRLDVQQLVLMSDLKIHARGVDLLDRDGTTLLHVPDIVVRPSLRALLHGFAGIGAVEISGAAASIVRRADGSFGISVAGDQNQPSPSGGQSGDFLEELLRPTGTDQAIGFLHRVRIVDARVNVLDLESGASWTVEHADVGLVRAAESHQLTLRAALAAGEAGVETTAIDAALKVQPEGDGFALDGRARFERIDVSRLGLYWPQNAAVAARRWVIANITQGRVPAVVVDLALASDSGVDFRLTRLTGNFEYEGLGVRWSDDVPPVTAVAGKATFDRSSMRFEIKNGQAGRLKIGSARVDLAGLDTDKEHLSVEVTGAGPFVAVLDQFPGGLKPVLETVGDTALHVKAALPLRAKLQFDDVDLRVGAEPQSLVVRYGTGSAVVSGNLRYQKPAKRAATLAADLDLRDAQVDSGAFRWKQPPGSKGKLGFHVDPAAQPLKFDPLHIDCPGLSARGAVTITDGGASGSATLRDLTYYKSELERLEMQWSQTGVVVRLGRGTLDLQPLLRENAKAQSPPGNDKPADLDITVDGLQRISLDRNSWMENVNATLVRERGEWRRILVTADLPRKLWSAGSQSSGSLAKKSFSVSLEPTGPGRRLEVRAPDFGALLRAVDMSNGVRGGTLVISGRSDQIAGASVLRSHVKVTDFTMAEVPLAVRILSVAALDKFVSTLKGEGLHFDSLKGIIVQRGNRYELDNLRAYGSSIGWTASGWVDTAASQLSIDGAIIPAYAANQVLKNIPLLGSLLTGADNRGLIAINYKVRGDLKDPKVSANPLTALTPGFLREVWELGK